MFLKQYTIEDTINHDTNLCFSNPQTYPQFQQKLEEFKNLLIDLVEKGETKTFYKFGDGDYFFLNKQTVGSAAPGRRALSIPYQVMSKHREFVEGVPHNDYITVEIYPENRQRFISLYPDKNIDYPAEYGYGLITNKWLLKTFAGKVGLIGAKEKVELISELMKKNQYKEYLGLDKFNDYLWIPQKFACDDIDMTEETIAEQLKNSNPETKIFLLGIGHVKSALLHRLKKYKNAVFLDVGSSIDALAGIIDFNRPYMGDWTNHRLTNFDYSKIDFLQYTPIPEKEIWL